MREIEATHITELDPFEVGPQPLTRIQLRSIGREPLQMDPVGCAVCQTGLDHVTAVNGRPIPDDDHAAGYFPQQMRQKGDDILRIERTVLAGEIQLALRRDRRDGRQMITGPPLPQDGRLPHRRIGAHDTGQRIKAGLVYKEDRLLLRCSPFLIAGHVSVRQRAIAASSR